MTLAIFSGVPDPVWTVHSGHESFKKFKEHLHNARTTRKIYRHEHMSSVLGYKGFLVHPPKAAEDELVVGHETKELQKLLLETMPEGLMPTTLRQKILHAIEDGSVSHQTQMASREDFLQDPSKGTKDEKAILHYAPKVNLARWNSYSLVRLNNNCYNYAENNITNSFAQPGYASGNPITSLTPQGVLRASESDGLVKMDVAPSDPCPPAPKQPNCLVALTVAEGVDYHWYRLDKNGRWSHKPGSTSATIYDGAGKLIYDPRKAVTSKGGPDYKFVSFMKTFTNIIDGPLGPHA